MINDRRRSYKKQRKEVSAYSPGTIKVSGCFFFFFSHSSFKFFMEAIPYMDDVMMIN